MKDRFFFFFAVPWFPRDYVRDVVLFFSFFSLQMINDRFSHDLVGHSVDVP